MELGRVGNDDGDIVFRRKRKDKADRRA